jgi:hypothetical protein
MTEHKDDITSWEMWAIANTRAGGIDGGFAYPSPHRRSAEAYRSQGEDIVRVIVEEDSEGPYRGWIGTTDTYPQMVFGHPSLFRMCFPYGPQAEVEAGRGRIVRLRIREIAAENV